MKYSLALAAFASLVVAQVDPTIIPPCARDCLNNATLAASSCKLLDFVCACQPSNYAAIQSAATGCVVSSCGADVAVNQVIPASKQLCAEALGSASGSAGAGAGGGGPPAQSAPAPAPPPNGAPSASSAMAMPMPMPSSMPGMPMSSAPPMSMPSSTPASMTSSAPSTQASTTAKNATATATHTPVPGAAAGIAPLGGLALLILGVLAI